MIELGNHHFANPNEITGRGSDDQGMLKLFDEMLGNLDSLTTREPPGQCSCYES